MDPPTLNCLSICSGIGGLELGLPLRTVCYVEREAYVASILVARMEEAQLDPAPIWDDLSTFDGHPWRGVVDCVTAGFPCQPVSLAGRGLGVEDARWLWPHIVRVLWDVEPAIVFLENVPGLVRRGLAGVLGDLAELGFDAEWSVFSAARSGAPHVRRRIFILAAHPDRGSSPGRHAREDGGTSAQLAGCGGEVAHSNRAGLEDRQGEPSDNGAELETAQRGGWWDVEPGMGRVVDGVSDRVDRIRALGNGVVPAVAARAWRVLTERMWRRS